MMIPWHVDLIRGGGHACAYTSRTLPAWYEHTMANKHLPVSPDAVHLYICLSKHLSAHFKQLIEQKLWKPAKTLGITPAAQSMLGDNLDDVTWNSGSAGEISQSGSIFVSCDHQWGVDIPWVCMPHHGAYRIYYSTSEYSPPDPLYSPSRTSIRY